MPVDDLGRYAFERVRPPAWIAILVGGLRAYALGETVAGEACKRDAVVLLEAFLHALEARRVAHVAQRHLQRGRRHFLHGSERGLRRLVRGVGEARDNALDVVRAKTRIDPRLRALDPARWRG